MGMPFRTIGHAHSGNGEPEPGLFVARTADDWAALWRTLTSRVVSEPPPAPAVDWVAETALVVALGMRPTGGYGVRIEEVRGGPEGIEVHACESRPGRSCFVTQALTYPVHAVAVPVHTAAVRLVMRVETVECE
jgi:hypothetical protein